MYTDQEIFNQNLLVTQAYCEKQLAENKDMHAAGILRSFNPEINGKPLFSYRISNYLNDDNYYASERAFDPRDSPANAGYKTFFTNQLLHKQKAVSTDADIIYNGKILVADIDETVVDGASEAVSLGFIDVYDCPPIDTWFYMAKGINNWIVLFAWIPEQFIPLVNEAIAVNCVDILYWYEDLEAHNKEREKLEKKIAEKMRKEASHNPSTKPVGFWNKLRQWLGIS